MTPYETEMLRCYAEPHRRYHDVNHVLDLFSLLRTGKMRGLQLPHSVVPINMLRYDMVPVIIDAIWAHDCVYGIANPPGYNERQSYDLWEMAINEHGSPAQLDRLYRARVRDMVYATIDHEIADQSELAYDISIKLFLDLDMAPLAVNSEQWDENTQAIRFEYTQGFTREQYDAGRKTFLQATLEKSHIYTEVLCDFLEGPARRNIERELKTLA